MANRLVGETSPYLLQHAGNPVDWYPWGEEALARAREEDRQILLSMGYWACHWCHVRAHESFEHAGPAAAMNRLFVNVKVDREERPDLDQIYQTAHQMLTGRPGGWPLTMFLTPDGMPFFGGTYFPPTPRHGLPAFLDICQKVADVYRQRRAAIDEQNASLHQALESTLPSRPGGEAKPEAAPLKTARDGLLAAADSHHGGFGGAPKFPQAVELGFLLGRADDRQAREVVLTALERMAEGGIYDQLGGGFFRYSVDDHWEIPHFEKMLSDNGQLLGLYARAWALTGNAMFARVVEETAGWAMREMQLPSGGFSTSLDADAQGEEGFYYVWDRREAKDLLTVAEWRAAALAWDLDGPPNFENHYWHLRRAAPVGEADAAPLESARAKLRAARERRPRPGRDEKVLTSWNALMISGLAEAGRIFARADWLASARRALDFLRERHWRAGRLYATERHPAYLDDHAFLIAALVDMLQARFQMADVDFAIDLAEALLARFEDPEAGGFFFTAHDHESLIHRPKPGTDGATPAGNGMAARALLRLGYLLGEPRYVEAAERTLRLFQSRLGNHAFGHAALLTALGELLAPPKTVILRGPATDVETWHQRLRTADAIVIAAANDASPQPVVMGKPKAPAVKAWLCHGVTCQPPVADFAELERAMGSS